MTQNGAAKTRQSTKRTTAIVALAGGATVTDAARHAGLGRRTVTRYMADDEFLAAIERTRAKLIERAVGRLADLSTKAIDRLAELLESDKQTVQLSAARVILQSLPQLREHAELSERLEELEQRLAETHITGFGPPRR